MKDEILKRLDTLADKLGTTAQYLFGLYVKQAHVQVVLTTTYGILALVCILAAYFTFIKGLRIDRHKDGGPWFVGSVVMGILGFILLIAFTCNDLYTPMMNPQYWAFKEILHDIHGQ